MTSRLASRLLLLRRPTATLCFLQSCRHVRHFSTQLLEGVPRCSKPTLGCYFLPNASPYQLWSRSFASENGEVEAVVPFMGESVTDGTLANFLKKPGDRVEADEPIAHRRLKLIRLR